MGLLDRRPGYYWVKITLTIFAFFAGWVLFVMVGDSWTTLAVAPLVGMMFTQLGFIGHDLGHNQVFATRRRNRMLGLAVANALIGLSFGWWVPKHNAHHAHPNEVGRDPDIGEGALTSPDAPGNERGPLASWLARWQAFLFFPLMLLRSSGMHVLGIKRLVRRRDRASAVEGSLILLHAVLYLTVVLWVLSPLKALAFIVVQQAVFSLYLGISFAPNHKGMPIIESATAVGFARRQVVTARNIRGGRFVTFMLGGLNYQIEHHLFPSMPRPSLRRVQGLVRDFCVAADLGYREESFVESFRQIVHYLRLATLPPGIERLASCGTASGRMVRRSPHMAGSTAAWARRRASGTCCRSPSCRCATCGGNEPGRGVRSSPARSRPVTTNERSIVPDGRLSAASCRHEQHTALATAGRRWHSRARDSRRRAHHTAVGRPS